jgi:2-amino-4-hydroxy-6-hydroxymethyldihydropteridine diphosphokinase
VEPEGAFAALSLGGNLGDMRASFRAALSALSQTSGVAVVATSSVYSTAPWGKTDQPDFLNMVALLHVRITPRALLDLCLAIEKDNGRDRGDKWGPRTLDLDVLTYGDESVAEEGLTIPHPHLHERAFVLVPLVEVAPDTQIKGVSVEQWLAKLDAQDVRKVEGL